MNSLYDQQREFFNKIVETEYSGKSHIDRVKDYALGIQKNVSDIVNALDWDPSKEPKSNSALHQKVEAIDAAIDIIKYAYNVCLEYNIDKEELTDKVAMKNRTVEQKFRQRQFVRSSEFEKAEYAFIFDIDGVLADIANAYLSWFSMKVKPFSSYEELLVWKTHNIDEWKRLKEEYRLSGFKMIIPSVEGTRELLKFCKSKGIVSLLSNRPVKTYPILYTYTVEWLHNRGIAEFVDMIHFTDLGEKKYFFDRFNGKEVYFFEDNVYNLINVDERPNVFNIFFKNETNKNVSPSLVELEEVFECNSLGEALKFMKDITKDDKDHNDLRNTIPDSEIRDHQ